MRTSFYSSIIQHYIEHFAKVIIAPFQAYPWPSNEIITAQTMSVIEVLQLSSEFDSVLFGDSEHHCENPSNSNVIQHCVDLKVVILHPFLRRLLRTSLEL
jgi:hypothetical protein